jgi:hypothetical protein
MRLTLRTLLAYMDGLLDAKDSQEIGKKIEDSKFAKDLFHKIRDVMRRLRLGAPSLTERAANLDCNTVAEYLDNALPGDRVPDFEEVSLKSDMHLAEVAACHQILAMVLGEPVEIDPESRQRMYQLPTVASRVDEERIAAAEAANMLSTDGNGPAPPAPPSSSTDRKTRPRPVVPEYLRDPPKKSRLVLAAAIMLLIGAGIGALALAIYPNGAQWLQAKLRGKSLDDDDRGAMSVKNSGKAVDSAAGSRTAASGSGTVATGSGATNSGATDSSLPGFPKDSSHSPPAKGSAADAGAESSVPALPPSNSAAAGKAAGVTPGAVSRGTASVASMVPPTAGLPAVGPPIIGPPANGAANPATATNPGGEKGPAAAVVGPDVKSGHAIPLPGTKAGGVDSIPAEGSLPAKPQTEVAMKPNLSGPAVGPANPPSAEDKLKIGRFISDGQDVLLKLDANNGWRRVLPEEFVAGRQPLLALPAYRPRLAVLNVGATLELINGTRIELLPDNAQGQPGVDIDFGRVVIKPLAQAGARLRVVAGSHTGTVTLTNVESIAGLEVTRVHDPGTDPEKVFSHALTRLYVARGGAIWEEGEAKPIRLAAPAELMLEGAVAEASLGAVKEVPKWITANTVNELDQRAALSVSQALSPQRAASIGLMELTEARQKEIKWLAARCLGYLGQFDPLTAALNDIEFRREWPDYIDQLKEAIARGPETAAGIRQSLEKQYGNESAALYRMLWGYTDKQLEDGEDARLVKFLDHESPVFRVLAFSNLNAITHQGLYYRPEANAAKRLPSVQQWRKQQQLGKIRYNVPDAKPRPVSGDSPNKSKVPEPPKPLDPGPPSEVNPASATEPIPPQPDSFSNPRRAPAGSPNVHRADRLPVAVPEPDPSERRPPIVVPEPQPGSGS